MSFKQIAGAYPYSRKTKRRFYRWAGKELGPILVKHDRRVRDAKGDIWLIRTFCNGKIEYTKLGPYWA